MCALIVYSTQNINISHDDNYNNVFNNNNEWKQKAMFLMFEKKKKYIC